jgi:hypothetical protein
VAGSLIAREDTRAHISSAAWRPKFFMVDNRITVRPYKKGSVVVEMIEDGMTVRIINR